MADTWFFQARMMQMNNSDTNKNNPPAPPLPPHPVRVQSLSVLTVVCQPLLVAFPLTRGQTRPSHGPGGPAWSGLLGWHSHCPVLGHPEQAQGTQLTLPLPRTPVPKAGMAHSLSPHSLCPAVHPPCTSTALHLPSAPFFRGPSLPALDIFFCPLPGLSASGWQQGGFIPLRTQGPRTCANGDQMPNNLLNQ